MKQELFSPLQVGTLTLKNRITAAPLYVGYANPDGTISQQTIDHYSKRAAGGASLVVVEASSVSPKSDNCVVNTINIHDDNCIQGLSKLAEGIKDNRACAGIQIFHAGRYSRVAEPVSASALPFHPGPDVTVTPKEMTLAEIEETINDFAVSAKRAQKAGFDLVELHCATGYLITQFISPLTNQRRDDYGGSLENRLRFPLNILKAVKEMTGSNFSVGARFLATDFLPGGFDLDQAKVLAQKLQLGGISYLSISGGVYESWTLPEVQKKLFEKGSLADLSKAIKDCVNVPVFAGNRIATPEVAQGILANQQADAVALGRPLLRDPEFPNKAKKGNSSEISECVSCFGCMGLVLKGKKVFCVQVSKNAGNA